MTNELKPCPFCGWDGELIEDGGQYYIECENSACPPQPTTPFVDTVETAVEDWNTRAVPNVPELVRYECEIIGDFIDSYGMAEHSDGDYVRYDRAAAMLALREQQIKDLEGQLIDQHKEIKVLKIKLAEYEKQEPIGWLHIHPDFNPEFSKFRLTSGDFDRGFREEPLYASPAPMESEK